MRRHGIYLYQSDLVDTVCIKSIRAAELCAVRYLLFYNPAINLSGFEIFLLRPSGSEIVKSHTDITLPA